MPATTATYPHQAEPTFCSRQSESPEGGQCLTVTVYFPDGSHDAESERLGDYGDWIAPEIVSEAEERLTRKLRRRIQMKQPETKPSL